jgi:hypothetical protein
LEDEGLWVSDGTEDGTYMMGSGLLVSDWIPYATRYGNGRYRIEGEMINIYFVLDSAGYFDVEDVIPRDIEVLRGQALSTNGRYVSGVLYLNNVTRTEIDLTEEVGVFTWDSLANYTPEKPKNKKKAGIGKRKIITD